MLHRYLNRPLSLLQRRNYSRWKARPRRPALGEAKRSPIVLLTLDQKIAMINDQTRLMLPGVALEVVEAVVQARREIWDVKNGRKSHTGPSRRSSWRETTPEPMADFC